MSLRDSALLLLGHGSTLNADSSAPTYQHADEIRRREIFAEVQVAFWKEEPNFRQALRQTRRRQVYVVPNFISSGYFTEQVIPRELGLSGPVTRIGNQEVFYCDPVGLHPDMTEALLFRASEIVSKSEEHIFDPARTACLIICGHGTSLNDNSTKIIHEVVANIRARGIYADCQPALMEQQPFIKDWRTLTACAEVIVVPFFISDGLHSYEDIPVLLGLTPNIREQTFTNPHRENDRRLWYANAIGTDIFIANVILAQVYHFQNAHEETRRTEQTHGEEFDIAQELIQLMAQSSPPWRIGEIIIRPTDRNSYHVMHRDDLNTDPATLRILGTAEDLRELIRLDREGNFRPLRAAPNLRAGWLLHPSSLHSLQLALDYIYPVMLANWTLWRKSALFSTAWNETAERQSGRYKIVNQLSLEDLLDVVAENCQTGCLKQRLWSPAAQPVNAPLNEVPLFCPEACNYLIGKVREKIKGPVEG